MAGSIFLVDDGGDYLLNEAGDYLIVQAGSGSSQKLLKFGPGCECCGCQPKTYTVSDSAVWRTEHSWTATATGWQPNEQGNLVLIPSRYKRGSLRGVRWTLTTRRGTTWRLALNAHSGGTLDYACLEIIHETIWLGGTEVDSARYRWLQLNGETETVLSEVASELLSTSPPLEDGSLPPVNHDFTMWAYGDQAIAQIGQGINARRFGRKVVDNNWSRVEMHAIAQVLPVDPIEVTSAAIVCDAPPLVCPQCNLGDEGDGWGPDQIQVDITSRSSNCNQFAGTYICDAQWYYSSFGACSWKWENASYRVTINIFYLGTVHNVIIQTLDGSGYWQEWFYDDALTHNRCEPIDWVFGYDGSHPYSGPCDPRDIAVRVRSL